MHFPATSAPHTLPPPVPRLTHIPVLSGECLRLWSSNSCLLSDLGVFSGFCFILFSHTKGGPFPQCLGWHQPFQPFSFIGPGPSQLPVQKHLLVPSLSHVIFSIHSLPEGPQASISHWECVCVWGRGVGSPFQASSLPSPACTWLRRCSLASGSSLPGHLSMSVRLTPHHSPLSLGPHQLQNS